MLDRKKGPAIHAIDSLYIPPILQYVLPNGVKVCEVNLGSQEILKMEIVHVAGRSVEDSRLISRATSSLMKEGCLGKNSAQIAEHFDYFGSSIKTASNMDFAYTTLHTLTKHFDELIPLVESIYFDPTFPEDEIQKFIHLNIQKLKEELTKNEVNTYRHITERIFGKDHPYGYNSIEEDYKKICSDKIKQHHTDYYGSDNCYIFLSGHITDNIRKQVSDRFGSRIIHSKKKKSTYSPEPVIGQKERFTSKNEHQSAIKVGRRMFDKHHEDNAPFFVLNTIYGGYFGSRLMETIREDKGYTYDIFSSIDQMLYDGCFYVSTEAATEYVDPILKEVYHQMDVLQQDKVDNEELQMVKSYLMGNFMNMLDGPMNVSSFAKAMILVGQQPEEFNDFVNRILNVDALTLVECAQKYFNKDEMKEIVITPG